MDSINQIELQNIRHLSGMATGACDKIKYYKTITTDQNVIDALDKVCTEFEALKTEVSNML